ncbi:MAG: fluoride efflux transporter CrcB [Hyphomicrobiaceae bacterium]
MRLLLLASMGGAIGAGARHLVNVGFGRLLGPQFPWSTIFINIAGSFVMGVLVEAIALRFGGSIEMRTFLATGILGGFTTFSAFSLDAYLLMTRGDTMQAALYVAASVVLSILGLFLGLTLTRQVLT